MWKTNIMGKPSFSEITVLKTKIYIFNLKIFQEKVTKLLQLTSFLCLMNSFGTQGSCRFINNPENDNEV